jgi:2-dehydropantoate 2-reductase
MQEMRRSTTLINSKTVNIDYYYFEDFRLPTQIKEHRRGEGFIHPTVFVVQTMASLPFFMEPLHVLGSGSIGLLWATAIRAAFPSYPLAALIKEHHKQTIQGEKEITVCLRQDRQRPRIAQVPVQFAKHHHHNSIQNLILSTKAFQAVDAVESIIPRLDKEHLKILVLCNGALDVRENLLDTLSKHEFQDPHLVMCTTTNGVYQETPDDDMFHLVQTGLGRTFVGDDGRSEDVPKIAQLWDRAGLNAKSIDSSQMEVLLWKKLAANCACNPLTALHECTNGQLYDQPDFSSTRDQVIKEVSQVARELNPELEEQLSPAALEEFVEITIQDNLQNTSSMHRDVQKQQQTEIDNLNGFIMRNSQQLNFECPANDELHHRIHELTIDHNNK